MKFVIDRSKWRCGGDMGSQLYGRGLTALLNEEGFMCCLGQVAEQCGETELLGIGEPSELGMTVAEGVMDLLVYADFDDYRERTFNTALSDAAMSINDSSLISHEERESQLIALFAKHGHELEFTGELVKEAAA